MFCKYLLNYIKLEACFWCNKNITALGYLIKVWNYIVRTWVNYYKNYYVCVAVFILMKLFRFVGYVNVRNVFKMWRQVKNHLQQRQKHHPTLKSHNV